MVKDRQKFDIQERTLSKVHVGAPAVKQVDDNESQ